jgi:hypothetical protein
MSGATSTSPSARFIASPKARPDPPSARSRSKIIMTQIYGDFTSP